MNTPDENCYCDSACVEFEIAVRMLARLRSLWRWRRFGRVGKVRRWGRSWPLDAAMALGTTAKTRLPAQRTATIQKSFGECGNGVCEPFEDAFGGCPEDCGGVVGECGDGICAGVENGLLCPEIVVRFSSLTTEAVTRISACLFLFWG